MDRETILEERGKENVDLVNRMKAYVDPLLVAFDKELDEAETKASSKKVDNSDEDGSDGSDDSDEDDSSGSGEEAEEINFPRNNAEDLLRFI